MQQITNLKRRPAVFNLLGGNSIRLAPMGHKDSSGRILDEELMCDDVQNAIKARPPRLRVKKLVPFGYRKKPGGEKPQVAGGVVKERPTRQPRKSRAETARSGKEG